MFPKCCSKKNKKCVSKMGYVMWTFFLVNICDVDLASREIQIFGFCVKWVWISHKVRAFIYFLMNKVRASC